MCVDCGCHCRFPPSSSHKYDAALVGAPQAFFKRRACMDAQAQNHVLLTEFPSRVQ